MKEPEIKSCSLESKNWFLCSTYEEWAISKRWHYRHPEGRLDVSVREECVWCVFLVGVLWQRNVCHWHIDSGGRYAGLWDAVWPHH